jgi:hypothetical protein
MERDRSSAETIRDAHQELIDRIEGVLAGIGADFSAGDGITLRQAGADPEVIAKQVRDKAEATARETKDIGSGIHPDDVLGFGKRIFSTVQLATVQTPSDSFSKTDTKQHGEWRVDYEAKIVP